MRRSPSLPTVLMFLPNLQTSISDGAVAFPVLGLMGVAKEIKIVNLFFPAKPGFGLVFKDIKAGWEYSCCYRFMQNIFGCIFKARCIQLASGIMGSRRRVDSVSNGGKTLDTSVGQHFDMKNECSRFDYARPL